MLLEVLNYLSKVKGFIANMWWNLLAMEIDLCCYKNLNQQYKNGIKVHLKKEKNRNVMTNVYCFSRNNENSQVTVKSLPFILSSYAEILLNLVSKKICKKDTQALE